MRKSDTVFVEKIARSFIDSFGGGRCLSDDFVCRGCGAKYETPRALGGHARWCAEAKEAKLAPAKLRVRARARARDAEPSPPASDEPPESRKGRSAEEEQEVATEVRDDELKQLATVPVSKKALVEIARLRDARLLATERAKLARAEADELRARGERPEALIAAIEQLRTEVAELRSNFEVAREDDTDLRRAVGTIEMRQNEFGEELRALRRGACPRCGEPTPLRAVCRSCGVELLRGLGD